MPRLQNRKRERFAIEIASMTPLERAYIEAGYKASLWSKFNASKLANTPEVRARIDELREEFRERSGLHAEYIQRKLLPLVEANARDLFDADGKVKSLGELPRDLTAAIQRIKVHHETGRVVDVSLYSKNETANVLLRSIGALVDRHEHSGPGGDPIEFENLTTGQIMYELVRTLRGTMAEEQLSQLEALLSLAFPVSDEGSARALPDDHRVR